MEQKVAYKMNLPADIDRWVRIEAAKACRSRSGHIIFLLREVMQAATGDEFSDNTPAAASRTDALQGVNSSTKG